LPGHPWGPRISPDGARLLYASAAPATAGRAADLDLNGSGSPDIWVADLDGAGARQLTDVPAGYNGWAWSPDGRRIAFASNRGGSWDLYVMAADGTDLARLTSSPAQDGWPTWTPDGAALVFASTRSDRAQLYRVDVRSGEVRRLLDSPTADTEPAVAPSGAIAFSAQATDGTGAIAVLDTGSTIPRRLPGSGGLDTAPTWSPDGAQLAFAGQRAGRSDVYVIGADGRGLVRLTATGQNQRPNWGPAPVASLRLSLAAQNGSGQDGTATLTDLGDGTTLVAVALANPPAVPQPLHIHPGTCAALAARVAHPLANAVGGASETVVGAPLAALLAAPHAINAHKSPQEAAIFVACGDIARPPG
jgi:Tol biopolymer transport system component